MPQTALDDLPGGFPGHMTNRRPRNRSGIWSWSLDGQSRRWRANLLGPFAVETRGFQPIDAALNHLALRSVSKHAPDIAKLFRGCVHGSAILVWLQRAHPAVDNVYECTYRALDLVASVS